MQVVTALTNAKDDLKEIDYDNAVAFVDKPYTPHNWELLPACDKFKDPVMNAKIHKVLIHKYVDAEYSLWIDASFTLKADPMDLVMRYLQNSDIAVHRHYQRDCIYREAVVCMGLNKAPVDELKEQIIDYKEEGYPEHNGLWECPIILRRHTKAMEKLNNAWWAEITRYSRRDQISFPYVLNKLGIKPAVMDGYAWTSNDFAYTQHNYE